jgi:hypothetical protein
MKYREALPENCPPEAAEKIVAARHVFRLVRSNPPTTDDFRSQRDLKPDAVFHGVTECQARGLSVHAERIDSDKARKLPRLKGHLICRIALAAGAGAIQQTGRPSHHTWWPLVAFDVMAFCTVETV